MNEMGRGCERGSVKMYVEQSLGMSRVLGRVGRVW